MRPLRIAHLADTHLGYRALAKTEPSSGRNQRTVDIELAFAWVIDDLLSREIDIVVHAGDLFHHTRPVYPAISAAIRNFRKLEKAEIPAYIIAGNHDTPRLRISGSVFGLLDSALPDLVFCGGYHDLQVENRDHDVVLTMVPHGRLTNAEPPAVYPVPNRRNLMVAHGLVPNMDLPYPSSEPGEEELPENLMDTMFDYIALGHFHPFRQVRRNAWYSGSSERITWRDEFISPGYAIATLGEPGEPAVVDHIANPTIRPMATYDLPATFGADPDGRQIADHVLQWMERLNEPEAMTRIMLKDIARPVRRHAESLIRLDADGLVWSVEFSSSGSSAMPFSDRNVETKTTSLFELFDAFVAGETAAGTYDAPFAAAFSSRGRHELEQVHVSIDTQSSAEGAE